MNWRVEVRDENDRVIEEWIETNKTREEVRDVIAMTRGDINYVLQCLDESGGSW